jgi:hypothetical protein
MSLTDAIIYSVLIGIALLSGEVIVSNKKGKIKLDLWPLLPVGILAYIFISGAINSERQKEQKEAQKIVHVAVTGEQAWKLQSGSYTNNIVDLSGKAPALPQKLQSGAVNLAIEVGADGSARVVATVHGQRASKLLPAS